MKIELRMKYIQAWIDHLGRRRYRFRRRGFQRVELPVDGDPSSPEFQAAYHAALRGEIPGEAIAAVAARGGSGSVRDAIAQYLDSTTFNDDYSASTKALRRMILNSVSRLVGNFPLAKMDRSWIDRWLETASTKSVKRTRLLALRPFLQWAVDPMRLIEADPSEGIRVKRAETSGHATWTDEQIAQFRSCHPLGSKARLALELLLNLASRRGDAIALGRQHVKDGWLIYTQQKNRKRRPVKVETPISAPLAAAIEACPGAPEALTFLTNEWGRPFTTKGFNFWFRQHVSAAGLPDTLVPHGLRKAGCRIMAESDCTPHEIMSVSGHSTLKEIERYTKGVDRKKLAARAQAKVAAAGNVVPLAVVGRG
jgi:integrase